MSSSNDLIKIAQILKCFTTFVQSRQSMLLIAERSHLPDIIYLHSRRPKGYILLGM